MEAIAVIVIYGFVVWFITRFIVVCTKDEREKDHENPNRRDR